MWSHQSSLSLEMDDLVLKLSSWPETGTQDILRNVYRWVSATSIHAVDS
jgi:hypothetical protein